MRAGRAITHPTTPGPGIPAATLLLGALATVVLLACSPLSAQVQSSQMAAQPSPHEGAPYTLHLYTRLVELPTLILGPNNRPVRSLSPKAINIELDQRPSFHPSSVRLEGQDPISLAILIDTQGEEFPLQSALQTEFSSWLTNSFGPDDRISLYAMNCSLFLTAFNRPPNPTLLGPALNSVIGSATSRKDLAACNDPTGLRNYIDLIMKQSSELPGRRVLLFLANGEDDKGTVRWQDLVSDATLYGVTVFGVNVPAPPPISWAGSFEELSQRSGGLNLVTTPGTLSTTLSQLIDLLRQRYILQFPMPADLTGNLHQVFVTVNKPTTVIRPSGITVPLNDPSTRTGPVNIPAGEPSANPTQPQRTPPPPAPSD